MTIGIYMLEFGNGAKYIGQSNNVELRLKKHLQRIREGQHSNWKVRACIGTPVTSILQSCSLAELNSCEINWITHYDSYNNGLNLTRGGGFTREVPVIPMPNPGRRDGYDNPNFVMDNICIILAVLSIACVGLVIIWPPSLVFLIAGGFLCLR